MGSRAVAPPILNLGTRWRRVGQLQALTALTPGKNHGAYWIGNNVDPQSCSQRFREFWDKFLALARIRTPDRLWRSLAIILTQLFWLLQILAFPMKIFECSLILGEPFVTFQKTSISRNFLSTSTTIKLSEWSCIVQSASDVTVTLVEGPRKSTACWFPRRLVGAGALLAV